MRDDIQIRNLTSQADLAACVELQRDTWGRNFKDVVPGSIMLVSQKVGGVAAGAFTGDGRLVGFVFGMTGVENGAIVHWSDMLAVRPEVQNLGVGRRLKEFQRQAVARVGASTIYWTYDPLVARNAHINFNVFGVRAVEYKRDMYGGDTGSDLHRDIGTDRLIVAWPVSDDDLSRRKRETSAAREAPVYVGASVIGDAERGSHVENGTVGRSEHLRLAVPDDIAAIQENDPGRATEWRASTRAAFESAFRKGYHVAGFNLATDQHRGFYLLARTQT
ncbi:MAG TPA: hypothetical protein VFT29_15585 [Gemmatimonadaceae bacterium]|nr:hypothetical protein [Gemmatimonadaceae bacterium]